MDNSRQPMQAKTLPAAQAGATPAADPSDVMLWLRQLGDANRGASSHLFELLYDELRRMARNHLRRENPGHTLSATSLAHEAWFRMAEQSRTQWQNRSHDLAAASTMMRRILVNHELARRANKRDWALARAWLHRELATR